MTAIVRLPVLVCAAALLAASSARAGTDVAFDVEAAYRSGPIHWKGPPGAIVNGDTTPFEIDTHVYGPGILSHLAVGGSLADHWVLAGEGGLGTFVVGSGFAWTGPNMVGLARIGARAEGTFGVGFVRAALGYEWMAFAEGSVGDIGARDNAWRSEATGGPYASASGGLRGRRVGIVGRLDLGRATSTHAVYWPITIAVGLDLAWR